MSKKILKEAFRCKKILLVCNVAPRRIVDFEIWQNRSFSLMHFGYYERYGTITARQFDQSGGRLDQIAGASTAVCQREDLLRSTIDAGDRAASRLGNAKLDQT